MAKCVAGEINAPQKRNIEGAEKQSQKLQITSHRRRKNSGRKKEAESEEEGVMAWLRNAKACLPAKPKSQKSVAASIINMA